jgi:hypothetical protein
MHGMHCRANLPVDQDDPVIFSFYTDISSNGHIIKMMLSLNEAIHKAFQTITQALTGGNDLTVYGLWNQKRRSVGEKLLEYSLRAVLMSFRSYMRRRTNQIEFKRITSLTADRSPVAKTIAFRGRCALWANLCI